MNEFNPSNLQALRNDLNVLLKTLEQKHNITLNVGKMTYTSETVNMKLSGRTAVDGGVTKSVYETDWINNCHKYGFKKEDLNKTFYYANDTYRIVGLKLSAYKNNIVVSKSGKNFVMPYQLVRECMRTDNKIITDFTKNTQGTSITTQRPKSVVFDEIKSIYISLSPENLSCDGELSASATSRRARELSNRLNTLFAEYGRRVTEDEVYSGNC